MKRCKPAVFACLFLFLCGCASSVPRNRLSLSCHAGIGGPILFTPDKPPSKICFTREEYAKIRKMKERCRLLPAQCKQRIKETLLAAQIESKRLLRLKSIDLQSCQKKRRICIQQKQSSFGLVKAMLISGVIGLAIGAVTATIIFWASLK